MSSNLARRPEQSAGTSDRVRNDRGAEEEEEEIARPRTARQVSANAEDRDSDEEEEEGLGTPNPRSRQVTMFSGSRATTAMATEDLRQIMRQMVTGLSRPTSLAQGVGGANTATRTYRLRIN